jgi:hypothetical protein
VLNGRFGFPSLALSVVLTLGARELSGQARVISLVATSPSNLSVVLTSGAIQALPAVTDNAVNNFPSPVVIQTTWSINPGQTNTVNLIAYFSVPAQAMMGATTQIPSSRILGRMSTGLPTAFTPITGNGIGAFGTAGGTLQLYSVAISGSNKSSGRTDNLDLQLNLVGFPTLPAGAYTGVLNLRVVTQ